MVLTARRGVGGALGSALLIRSHASAALRSHTLRHNRLDVFQQVHTKFRIIYKSFFCTTVRVHLLLPEYLHLRTLLLNERRAYITILTATGFIPFFQINQSSDKKAVVMKRITVFCF